MQQYKNEINNMKKILISIIVVFLSNTTIAQSHFVDSLANLSVKYYNEGKYQEGIGIAIQVQQLVEKEFGKEHEYYATSLDNLAQFYSAIGNYSEAIRLETEALKMSEKVLGKEHPQYSKSLNNVALYKALIGKYDEAIRIAKQAFQIREKIYKKNQPEYVEALNTLAFVEASLGNYSEAIRFGQKALQIAEKEFGKNHPYYEALINNLAQHNANLGNYSEAIRFGTEAVQIREKNLGNLHPNYAISLSNLAGYYSQIGNYDEALRLGTKVLEIKEKTVGKEHPSYIISLSNLAMFYWNIGDFSKAILLDKEGMQITEKNLGKNNPNYVTLINNLALSYFGLANFPEALRNGEEGLKIVEEIAGKYHPYYATSLSNIARYHAYMGNFTDAIKLSKEALQIKYSIFGNQHPEYASSLYDLAEMNFVTGDTRGLNKYVTMYHNAIHDILFKGFSEMPEYERNNYWSMYKHIFQNYIHKMAFKYPTDTLVSCGYNAALLSKGLLLNLTKDLSEQISESNDKELISLYSDLKNMRFMLQKQYEKPIAIRTLNTDSIEKVVNGLEMELMSKSKIYGDYTKNINIRWIDVREKMTEKDVCIEFVSFPYYNDSTMYIAYVLQKNMDTPVMIQLFEERQLKIDEFMYVKKDASKLIWEPLKCYLENKDNIYFSPSGELYNIAIEALPHWDNGNQMSDNWNLFRLSSTRELAVQKDRFKIKHASIYGGVKYDAADDVLVANSKKFPPKRDFNAHLLPDSLHIRSGINPLPATKEEAMVIDKTLKKKKIETVLRLDTLATESDLKNLDGRKTDLLHIATHGFYWTEREAQYREDLTFLMLNNNNIKFAEDKALTRSGLLFAGANNVLSGKSLPEGVDDGVLTAKEISQLDLRGLDLVVLSACQTGLGEIKGDGVFGLQRGFKKAGVNSILMSLWKVDDEATKLLMTEFYKHLTSKKSKQESLQIAQNYVKNYMINGEKKYQAPSYWAAFVLLDAIN